MANVTQWLMTVNNLYAKIKVIHFGTN